MREQQSDLGADYPLRNTARALERVVRAELETYILPADLRHFADVDPDWQSKRLARGGRLIVSNGGVGLYLTPGRSSNGGGLTSRTEGSPSLSRSLATSRGSCTSSRPPLTELRRLEQF